MTVAFTVGITFSVVITFSGDTLRNQISVVLISENQWLIVLCETKWDETKWNETKWNETK